MSEETPTPEATEAPAETPPAATNTIPYERFSQKVAEVKALEEKLAAAATWETKHNELAATVDAERKAWGQTQALYKAGVTSEEVGELAKWRFEKSGAEDFGAWLAADALSDPLLKSHLAPQEAPPPVEVKTTPAEPPAAPVSPNNGAITTPPPRGTFTPEAVQSMSIEDLKANYGKIASAWGYPGGKVS